MIQRSRIAPPSDAQMLRRHCGKGPPRLARAALRQVTVAVVLACMVYALPGLVGPGFFHDRVGNALAFAAVGEWARATLVAAFESIPVW